VRVTMEEKIKKWLAEQGLSEMEQEIVKTLVPCIMIETTGEGVATGASKFGGLPDLPPDMGWPCADGKPLIFAAQYNLAEIHRADRMNPLPDRGMLYFFLAGDDLLWGTPRDSVPFEVLYRDVDPSSLQPAIYPDDLSREACPPEQGIRFRLEKALPDVEASGEMDALWYDLMDQLYELEERSATHHQAFGQPLSLEADVFATCRRQTGKETPDWVLLLQMDSDEELEMAWGRFGILSFCISQEDLLTGRFDETCLVIQRD
jgi:uncharacterized protein YwqG